MSDSWNHWWVGVSNTPFPPSPPLPRCTCALLCWSTWSKRLWRLHKHSSCWSSSRSPSSWAFSHPPYSRVCSPSLSQEEQLGGFHVSEWLGFMQRLQHQYRDMILPDMRGLGKVWISSCSMEHHGVRYHHNHWTSNLITYWQALVNHSLIPLSKNTLSS